MDTDRTPIQLACEATGGQALMAAHLGISPAQDNQWCKGLRPVPLEYCLAIARASGGQVTRADLRPDDYWEIWPDLKPSNTKKKAA